MPLEFNGTESAEDVLKQALEEFSRRCQERPQGGTIVYQNNVPFLRYQPRITSTCPEQVCLYRVDTMLLPFFKEAVKIYDTLTKPLNVLESLREPTIRYIACFGMVAMLGRLMILQSEIIEGNFEEGKFVTSTFLLHSLAQAIGTPKGDTASTGKLATKTTKKWLDQIIGEAMKKKRDFLVAFINSQPLFHIQGVGRPPGSTKPEEKKKQEAVEFDTKVEQTIRKLLQNTGNLPNKTAVAKEIGVGGWNRESGTDNRLVAFSAKLKRLGLNFDSILERVRLNK